MRTFIMAEKMTEKMTDSDKESTLVQIMNAQNELLDCILEEQSKMHETVKNRQWHELETCLSHLEAYSDAFVSLDNKRETLVSFHKEMYFLPAVEPIFTAVRSKLSKSKIENQALSSYVQATQSFLTGVLEQCVPQNRNTLYTKQGAIKKPEMQSVVVNRLF